MALRIIFFVALAILAYRCIGRLREEEDKHKIIDKESDSDSSIKNLEYMTTLIHQILESSAVNNVPMLSESPAPGAGTGTTGAACREKINTSDGLLAYTKNCLGFSKEAMDCVSQKIKKREQDGFPIALACTPNLPDSVKQILKKLFRMIKKRKDVVTRCWEHNTQECANELIVLTDKYDKVWDRYEDTYKKLHGPAKKAHEKFSDLINRIAATLNFSIFV